MAAARRAAALAACMLLAASCAQMGAAMPDWYTCDPATCMLPDCQCASTSPPGGLAPEDTPQFVVLTHDDAINAETNQKVRAVIDKHTNRNGCNVPATFFVLELGTQCDLAKAFWEENSELAVHSRTHAQLLSPWPGPGTMEEEMFSARRFLNDTCGIPLEDLVGFRAPLLYHNPQVRATIAAEGGMLYDSTIAEFWGPNSQISANATDRLWPYTMDSGIPQNCGYFSGNVCNETERYPGLWEVPLLALQAENSTLLYTMDPGRSASEGGYGGAPAGDSMPPDQLEALLKQNFDYSYYGNRAPWGLYIHSPWLTEERTAVANSLLDYILSLNGTYIVTMHQVIEWMQNPVPISEMDDWLTCKDVDLSEAPGVVECQVYTAVQGDSGSAIADRFGVELEALEALNPDLLKLQVGQKVRVPPFPATCGAGVPTAGPPGAAPPPELATGRRLLRSAA